MTTEGDRNVAMWVHAPRNPKVCLLLQRCSEILKGWLCDVLERTLFQLPSSPWCEPVNLLWDCRDSDDEGESLQ